ncbi:MAG: CRISPR-associated protein Csm4 [Eubacteriales bacterium]|nr:CRISPR-associated protein Csm4 [Eubacteriales bacterium]MDN5364326.1 CRISPR-associated protein Csm4 [Eubacteriales bacterium]
MAKIAVLDLKGPVHFGVREESLTRIRPLGGSDLLFSGIVNCFRLLFGEKETEEFLAAFHPGEEPPLLLSSLFPVVEERGKEPLYFLPRPLSLDLTPYFPERKEAKKIAFLPAEFLRRLAEEGELPDGERRGPFYFPTGEGREIFWEEERPRVALDAITSASSIYYASVTRFAPGVCLYFFWQAARGWEEKIKAALRLLGDEGLGGERSYGLGGFVVKDADRSPFPWLAAEEDCSWLLLSGFSPAEKEKDLAGSLVAWGWREEGGYLYSLRDTGRKRQRCLLLGEGSVFKKRVVGRLVDVTPAGFGEHRVYRYGYAYLLPWREVKR